MVTFSTCMHCQNIIFIALYSYHQRYGTKQLKLTWNRAPITSIFPMTTSTGNWDSICPIGVSFSPSVRAPCSFKNAIDVSTLAADGASINGNLKHSGLRLRLIRHQLDSALCLIRTISLDTLHWLSMLKSTLNLVHWLIHTKNLILRVTN